MSCTLPFTATLTELMVETPVRLAESWACMRCRVTSSASKASLLRSTWATSLTTGTALRVNWVPSGKADVTAPVSQSLGPLSRAVTIWVPVEARDGNHRRSGTRLVHDGSKKLNA
jgi:hypothetical protein